MAEGKPLLQIHRALADLCDLRAFLRSQPRDFAATEGLSSHAEMHVRWERPVAVEVVLGCQEYAVNRVEFGIWKGLEVLHRERS